MKRQPDRSVVKQAVSNSSTNAALVGLAIDSTGYSRAKFVFHFASAVDTASIRASSLGIWAAGIAAQSVISATTYAAIPGAYLAVASGPEISQHALVLDVAIPAGKQFLKVSGTITSTYVTHSATVELYQPLNAPPTHGSPQPVIVN